MITYNLFVSHSWAYGDAYDRLLSLLESKPRFYFKNYSVPRDNPIHNTSSASDLRAAIKLQMQPTNVILILAGVYATYSKWINEEIRLAKEGFSYPKSIIAIEPWGSEQTSAIVKQSANEIVKWNTDSIVGAIRRVS